MLVPVPLRRHLLLGLLELGLHRLGGHRPSGRGVGEQLLDGRTDRRLELGLVGDLRERQALLARVSFSTALDGEVNAESSCAALTGGMEL